MSDERAEVAPRDLVRWVAVAAVVVAGLLLFFWLSPRTHPVPVPTTQEAGG